MLLEKGVDLNMEGGGYGSVLQAASSHSHNKIICLLLQKAAEAGVRQGASKTMSSNSDGEVAALLKAHSTVNRLWTVVHYTCQFWFHYASRNVHLNCNLDVCYGLYAICETACLQHIFKVHRWFWCEKGDLISESCSAESFHHHGWNEYTRFCHFEPQPLRGHGRLWIKCAFFPLVDCRWCAAGDIIKTWGPQEHLIPIWEKGKQERMPRMHALQAPGMVLSLLFSCCNIS